MGVTHRIPCPLAHVPIRAPSTGRWASGEGSALSAALHCLLRLPVPIHKQPHWMPGHASPASPTPFLLSPLCRVIQSGVSAPLCAPEDARDGPVSDSLCLVSPPCQTCLATKPDSSGGVIFPSLTAQAWGYAWRLRSSPGPVPSGQAGPSSLCPLPVPTSQLPVLGCGSLMPCPHLLPDSPCVLLYAACLQLETSFRAESKPWTLYPGFHTSAGRRPFSFPATWLRRDPWSP